MAKEKGAPEHIAVIMDGNGRWAERRGLPKIMGHRAGVKAAQAVMEAANAFGVKALTLYAFSTENWKRPKEEVGALFGLLQDYIDREGGKFVKKNIRFRAIGRIKDLGAPVRERLERLERRTKDNTGLIVNLAVNYGGRPEIVDAARALAADVKSGKLRVEDIDEDLFAGYLYTKGLSDPDLLIRTSGEYRISNFLIWQIAYAEIYVTKKLWPDFGSDDLKKAIDEYRRRDRRFGG